MSQQDDRSLAQQEVVAELAEMEKLAHQFSTEDFKRGDWFLRLLQMVVMSYERNSRSSFFQQKYPGLLPDEIAEKLISVTARYASIAGGVGGASATTLQIETLASMGLSLPLLLSVIGAEMLYLARIQIRLILDLAVIYDLQLDPDDPEDVLMLFGYAFGVAPTEMLGNTLTKVVTPTVTRSTIKKYISKGTLEAVKEWGRKIGIKILQRTIIKYSVPAASAAIGASYNYITTRSIGSVAKMHFKKRGLADTELFRLLSKENIYQLIFPAALTYMMNVDGRVDAAERQLYRAMLSRMTIQPDEQGEFDRLQSDEEYLLDAIGQIETDDMRKCLFDALCLMAISDGELATEEITFLKRVSCCLEIAWNAEALGPKISQFKIDKKSPSQLSNTLNRLTQYTAQKTRGWKSKVSRNRISTRRNNKLREP
ncbi:MAG TPA: TerB family tellurite resistance protein [Aggregatilineaceae bacterium]|nr:TerB family tellurite resistance protein [Aggregatilineaceae bacterium]